MSLIVGMAVRTTTARAYMRGSVSRLAFFDGSDSLALSVQTPQGTTVEWGRDVVATDEGVTEAQMVSTLGLWLSERHPFTLAVFDQEETEQFFYRTYQRSGEWASNPLHDAVCCYQTQRLVSALTDRRPVKRDIAYVLGMCGLPPAASLFEEAKAVRNLFIHQTEVLKAWH